MSTLKLFQKPSVFLKSSSQLFIPTKVVQFPVVPFCNVSLLRDIMDHVEVTGDSVAILVNLDQERVFDRVSIVPFF